jgi:hypothetical protein
MNEQRLSNFKNGFTEDKDGNKFAFTSPVPGVHIYDNVWPKSMDFLNQLLNKDFWEQNKENKNYRKWVREDFFDNQQFTKDNGKQADTCWIYSHPDANKEIGGPLNSYLYHWNLDPKSRESLRITRYSSGEFFGSHSDDTFATPRTVSIVYYPNDDYEGGELEFIHFGVKIKPKANQLFVFPSSYAYEHKIHEIGEGNPRWTIVSFLFFGTMEEADLRRKGLKFPYEPIFKSLF